MKYAKYYNFQALPVSFFFYFHTFCYHIRFTQRPHKNTSLKDKAVSLTPGHILGIEPYQKEDFSDKKVLVSFLQVNPF